MQRPDRCLLRGEPKRREASGLTGFFAPGYAEARDGERHAFMR
jgi:hypothetical protein